MIIINLYCSNIGVDTWCFYCLFLLQSMNKDFFDSLVILLMKIDFIKSLCCLKELPLGGFTILELKRTENDSFVEHMSQNA